MNKSETTVSVVIPVYNRANTIERCIDSVLFQTYKNFEIIVVDDGSTDETEKIVLTYINKNTNVYYYKRPEGKEKGANACRNLGMNLAKGDFIALLDSDDEWLPNHIFSNISILRTLNSNYGLYSGAIIDKGVEIRKKESRSIKEGESYLDFLLSSDGFAQTSSFFFSNAAAKSVQFDESLKRHQDWDFFIRFGERWGWEYNPRVSVKIHWEKGLKRAIEFKSCIKVYLKFKNQISNHSNGADYILYMLEAAIKHKAERGVIDFYRKEISTFNIELNFRQKILVHFPNLFFVLHKVKNL